MPDQGNSARLLKSWKEVAAYLGRDVRTAIRWEKEKSLPIHRPPGARPGHKIYAYPAELDAWMSGEQRQVKVAIATEREIPSERVAQQSYVALFGCHAFSWHAS